MARSKGSKNKVKDDIDLLVEETISGHEGLLDTEIIIKEPEIIAQIKPMERKKTLVGYHPITGEEVYI